MHEIVLHIGTEKTGTTTIQEFFSANREILEANNILYPKSMGNKNHIKLAMCAALPNRGIHRKINNDPVLLSSFKAVTLSDWHKELKATKADKIVFSSEHLHSQIRSLEELKCLKNLLPVSDFRIIMYIRRQDKAAVSLASTAIKAGYSKENFFPKIHNKTPHRFDYLSSYKLWAEVFGEKSISIRIFDPSELKNGDLLEDICSIIDIPWNDKFKIPARKNKSLDVNGLFLMNILNQLKKDSEKFNPNIIRKLILNISENFTDGHRVMPSREEAKKFYSHFIDDNEELRRLALPHRNSPIFNTNFSDYSNTININSNQADINEIIKFLLRELLQG